MRWQAFREKSNTRHRSVRSSEIFHYFKPSHDLRLKPTWFENLINGGNLLASELRIKPTASVEFSDLCQRKLRDLASAIGRSVQSAVVNAHQVAVFGSLYVELEAKTEFEASTKIGKSVLGCVTEQTSMGNDERLRISGIGVRISNQDTNDGQYDFDGCSHGLFALAEIDSTSTTSPA